MAADITSRRPRLPHPSVPQVVAEHRRHGSIYVPEYVPHTALAATRPSRVDDRRGDDRRPSEATEPHAAGPRRSVMGNRARTFRGLGGVALAISLTGLALTGCSHSTGHPTGKVAKTHILGDSTQTESVAVPLKRYASCEEALATLRLAQAAANAHNPRHPTSEFGGAPDSARNAAPAAPGGAPGAGTNGDEKQPSTTSAHSTTNTAEPGVDEPDTVKTDGKIIVTVHRGTVSVVSTSDKRIEGSIGLEDAIAPQEGAYYSADDSADQLLLAGDRVLAISRKPATGMLPYAESGPASDDAPQNRPQNRGSQTTFTLIDISDPAHPRTVSTLHLDGDFIDARMMGTTVRAVTRTNPVVPQSGNSTGTDWLPHYSLESHLSGTGGIGGIGGTGTRSISEGSVDCASVIHPDTYSGTALLSLETFDLAAPANRYSLGTGNAVSVVADGDTVYATGSSLYVANDLQAWRGVPLIRPGFAVEGSSAAKTHADPYTLPSSRTEVFKFDVSGTAAPRPVASGTVPGWLLNQYSLSEYQGNLRIATTDSAAGDAGGAGRDIATAATSSAVYVLAPRGDTLARIGAVTGLGEGEKIYSVRFAGPVGYVVTFRQMDPLFVIDLRDPSRPKAVGKLDLTGYSSYLHPVDDKTLIGLGQASSGTGRRQGTQVSLFDVSDPSAPRLTARYELPGASSTAEGDPHAFLYWAPTGMLVVPLSQDSDGLGGSASGALVLRVGNGGITEEGFVKHAGRSAGGSFGSIPGVERITRSLVTNDTLWTVSDAGLLGSKGLTLEDMGWIPYP
ncbi:MAG: beta-propeller domain-containing protein [Catenulisporales bacterium]|nr:beta-propeller domain-containing protein [Catenulisporales bacterium]